MTGACGIVTWLALSQGPTPGHLGVHARHCHQRWHCRSGHLHCCWHCRTGGIVGSIVGGEHRWVAGRCRHSRPDGFVYTLSAFPPLPSLERERLERGGEGAVSRVVRSTGGWQLLAAGLSTSRGTPAEHVQGAACQGLSNVQEIVVSPPGMRYQRVRALRQEPVLSLM